MSEILRKKKELGSMVPTSPTDQAPFIAAATAASSPTVVKNSGDKPDTVVPARDPDYGRSFPGGATTFDQNRNFLNGAPLRGLESNIQQQTQQGQNQWTGFQQQAIAGAPATPFGEQQRQTIEAGLQPGANQQQEQAVRDLIGTQYTGPEGMSKDIMGGSIQNRTTAGELGGGGTYAGMLGAGTSGERREEAARFIGDPKGQKRVGEVQRAADTSYRKLSDIQSKEQPLVQQQQQRATEHAEGTRGYLQTVQQNVEGRTQVEVDKINENNKIATEMFNKFKETGDVKDLEGAPQGYFDPSVYGLAETPAGKMSEEAKVAWQEVWDSPEFSAIGNVPLMRRSVSGQGYEDKDPWNNPGNQSYRLDPQWLMSPAGQDLFGDIMGNTPDGGQGILSRYMMGYNWLPGSSGGQNDVIGASKRGRGERRAPMPGWDAFTPEQADAIHRLEMYHTRARERQASLVDAGFGKGGEREIWRPIDGFGFVREWDPLSYARFVTPLVTKTATIASTMTLADRKRFNAAADFLGAAVSAYEEKDPESLTPVMGKMQDLIEAEAFELERRADTLDRNQQEWLRIVRRVRRQYRSHRHDVNMKAFTEFALTVIGVGATFALVGPAIFAGGAAGGTGALAGAIEVGAALPGAFEAAQIGGTIAAGAGGLSAINQSESVDLTNAEIQMLAASARNTAFDMGAEPDHGGTVGLAGDWTPYGRRYAEGDAVIYDRDEPRTRTV